MEKRTDQSLSDQIKKPERRQYTSSDSETPAERLRRLEDRNTRLLRLTTQDTSQRSQTPPEFQSHQQQKELDYLTQTHTGTSYINLGDSRIEYTDLIETEHDTLIQAPTDDPSECLKSPTQEHNPASGPCTYEEWKNTVEGQDPQLKPVQSPEGGHIYGYNPRDFSDFKKKTKMEGRPPKDQIQQGPLDQVVSGSQKGAGKGKKKWTSPDPNTQERLQQRLNKIKERAAERRKDLKEDPEAHQKHLNKEKKRNAKYLKNRKEDPETYQEHLDKEKKISAKRRKDRKEDPETYQKHLDKEKKRAAERRKDLKEDPEAWRDYLDEQKKRTTDWYNSMKDPKNREAHYKRKYERYKERYTRTIYLLDKKLDEANTLTQCQELQQEKDDLTQKWEAFQQKHQVDLNKLESLLQTQDHLYNGLEQYSSPQQHGSSDLTQQHIRDQMETLESQIMTYFEESRETNDLNDLLDYLYNTHDPSKTNPD